MSFAPSLSIVFLIQEEVFLGLESLKRGFWEKKLISAIKWILSNDCQPELVEGFLLRFRQAQPDIVLIIHVEA